MISGAGLSDQTIGVFGLARSGLAAIKALHASGATVYGDDDDADRRAALDAIAPGIGRAFDDALLAEMDALMLAPGVPLTFPAPHPIVLIARALGVRLIADFDLFETLRPELPAHKVIAITGTNGKSTTTALITHVLTACGMPSVMGGNIGTGVMDLEPLPAGGVYVLEMSSFQLDLCRTLKPDVSLLINMAPDHLDRHGSMDAYMGAKKRVFQLNEDAQAIIGCDDDFTRRIWADMSAGRGRGFVRISGYGAEGADISIAPADYDIGPLRGAHNAQNIAATLGATRALGIADDQAWQAIKSFPGLAHRQEWVIGDPHICFINDSKATNIDAARRALTAFERVHWLAGGINADGDALLLDDSELAGLEAGYFYGRDRQLFVDLLAGRKPCSAFDTLEGAFANAYAKARTSGGVVLLSPASKAFDLFRDFEKRGEAFKTLVRRTATGTDVLSEEEGGGHP